MIIIAIISMFAIGLSAFGANKFLPFKICPVCAGVAGTWMWLLAGIYLGYPIDPIIPAVLMGGSVVGIYYQFKDKVLPRLRNRKPVPKNEKDEELKKKMQKKMDKCC